MLRFFSRRKPRGRQEQKVGAAAGLKRPPAGKINKNVLACNIILLDGSDLGLEIPVSSNGGKYD
jgi:hypothetical protein